MSVCLFVYMYVCMYVCMSILISIASCSLLLNESYWKFASQASLVLYYLDRERYVAIMTLFWHKLWLLLGQHFHH